MQSDGGQVEPDEKALVEKRVLWKLSLAAAAFALGSLFFWEAWLKQIWESLALPELHHYWYGIVLMLCSFEIHRRKGNKKLEYPLLTIGLIWFFSDFPDLIAQLDSLIYGLRLSTF